MRTCSPDRYRHGPLAPFLAADRIVEVADETERTMGVGPVPVVFSGYRLQDAGDYRAAIQRWFAAVGIGGFLVIVVPHAFLYERQNMLPSRWRPRQRRLYTPRSLMEEVEEALEPNSYRVRLLADDDAGYDYQADPGHEPQGAHDMLLVLERIVQPGWELSSERAESPALPNFAFEPQRTRREVPTVPAIAKILIVKLDHVGDFIMGLDALRHMRDLFPSAHITLVVGSWNVGLAESLGVADCILEFDVFPRNSNEDPPDAYANKAGFDALVVGEFDLAVDLRVETDTRFLLRDVRASFKAGIGNRPDFRFLDIFLPIDHTRHDVEAAWQRQLAPLDLAARSELTRSRFQIACNGAQAPVGGGALVWGPYWMLRAGDYVFEPYIELETATRPGLLAYDVALDHQPCARGLIAGSMPLSIRFSVAEPEQQFEFRLWPVEGEPVADFQLFGGRLLKRGSEGVLHQSEYIGLLVKLIEMRLIHHGILRDRDDH